MWKCAMHAQERLGKTRGICPMERRRWWQHQTSRLNNKNRHFRQLWWISMVGQPCSKALSLCSDLRMLAPTVASETASFQSKYQAPHLIFFSQSLDFSQDFRSTYNVNSSWYGKAPVLFSRVASDESEIRWFSTVLDLTPNENVGRHDMFSPKRNLLSNRRMRLFRPLLICPLVYQFSGNTPDKLVQEFHMPQHVSSSRGYKLTSMRRWAPARSSSVFHFKTSYIYIYTLRIWSYYIISYHISIHIHDSIIASQYW